MDALRHDVTDQKTTGQGTQSSHRRGSGSIWGWIVADGVVGGLVGILALAYPGVTVLALALLLGVGLLVQGVTGLAAGIGVPFGMIHRVPLIIMASFALVGGVLCLVRPGVGVLALVIGLAIWFVGAAGRSISSAVAFREYRVPNVISGPPAAQQDPLPVWVAVGGTPRSVVRAGVRGLPMALAILAGHVAQLAPLVDLHREALSRNGQSPAPVAIIQHGFVADTSQRAADIYYSADAEVMNRIGRERGFRPTNRREFDAKSAPVGPTSSAPPRRSPRRSSCGTSSSATSGR